MLRHRCSTRCSDPSVRHRTRWACSQEWLEQLDNWELEQLDSILVRRPRSRLLTPRTSMRCIRSSYVAQLHHIRCSTKRWAWLRDTRHLSQLFKAVEEWGQQSLEHLAA